MEAWILAAFSLCIAGGSASGTECSDVRMESDAPTIERHASEADCEAEARTRAALEAAHHGAQVTWVRAKCVPIEGEAPAAMRGTWEGAWHENGVRGTLTVGAQAGPGQVRYCYDGKCSRLEYLSDVRHTERSIGFTWGGRFEFQRIGNALTGTYHRGADIAMHVVMERVAPEGAAQRE